jgi:hypothetical protein
MEQGDTPFIHRPDEVDDDPVRNGLTCFMDQLRPCGADCMAYTTYSDGSLMGQAGNCILLVNAERSGKHLVILAKLTNDMINGAKRAAADQRREAQVSPSPPKVV